MIKLGENVTVRYRTQRGRGPVARLPGTVAKVDRVWCVVMVDQEAFRFNKNTLQPAPERCGIQLVRTKTR